MDRYDYLSEKHDQLHGLYNVIAEGKELNESTLEDIRVFIGETMNEMTNEMEGIQFNEKYCPEPLELEEPLLYITLDDINSVPVVYYKGEEIDKKIRVTFDYLTDDVDKNPTYIHIEHADTSYNTRTIHHNQPYDTHVNVYGDDVIQELREQ